MIVLLKVSNYDIVGGTHFYGALLAQDQKIEVTKILSKTEARLLNEAGRRRTYFEGDTSESFRELDRLRKNAIAQRRQHWPEASHLIESHYTPAQPQLVLDGPGKDELNALYEECGRLGWWDGKHYDHVRDLCDEWDALLERLSHGEIA